MEYMFRIHHDGNNQLFKSLLQNHVQSFETLWYDNACKKSLDNYVSFKQKPLLENYLLDKVDF